MAETLVLLPPGSVSGELVTYLVEYGGTQREKAGVRYRLGMTAGFPVVAKSVVPGTVFANSAQDRLRREFEVAGWLRGRGGERIAHYLGADVALQPTLILASVRGRRLDDLVRDQDSWPLEPAVRAKAIRDLIEGLEVLRVSRVVHGAIGLDTLHWDGSTLQINDFSGASMEGHYPDGRPAQHADDVMAAALVIFQLHTGEPPPVDPVELRRQLVDVYGGRLRDLLLRRDPVTGTDVYYAFSADPGARPTSQMLLAKLTGPHGIQAPDLEKREQAARDAFRELRDRQGRSRVAYARWAEQQRPRSVPRDPASGTRPPHAQPPRARRPHGQPPYGQPPHAQPPYGQPPHGQPPYPYAQPSDAQPPYGQPPRRNPWPPRLPGRGQGSDWGLDRGRRPRRPGTGIILAAVGGGFVLVLLALVLLGVL